MRPFPIRCLLFLSMMPFAACNQYRHLQSDPADPLCLEKFKPVFLHATYKTSVDVVGKHISGLLLIKMMPDSSIRFVFSNQMGFSFFDLGFLPDNGFKVFQIIPQMNKEALIKTLRKDFELILFRNINNKKSFSLQDSSEWYHGFSQSKGVNYYVTDIHCNHLIKMQRASNRKPVMEAVMDTPINGSPDSISIRHLNFNFSITLKKISTLATE